MQEQMDKPEAGAGGGLQIRANGRACAVLVFITTLAVGSFAIWKAESARMQRAEVSAHLAARDAAAKIERHLDRALSVSYALAAALQQNDGKLRDFDTLGAELLRQYRTIDEIAIAPGGVYAQVAPLRGNESVVGFNPFDDPAQKVEARIARATRSLTLAGPMHLVQGGEGVVARLPVFMQSAREDDGFWGIVSIVIRTSHLLSAADLNRLAADGYDWRLWRINPVTGARQVIAGSAGPDLASPVSYRFEVPNGEWTLDLAPIEGWISYSRVAAEVAGALAVAILAALLVVFVYITEQSRAREELRTRTAELKSSHDKLLAANRDLRSFTYMASHDLNAPVRRIAAYSALILKNHGADLSQPIVTHLRKIISSAQSMRELIRDLLILSGVERRQLLRTPVDLSAFAREIRESLFAADPGRKVEFRIEDGIVASCDPGLAQIALQNLLDNAWKYTAVRETAVIEFGSEVHDRLDTVYYVSDNGAGFDMTLADGLFQPFVRLHCGTEFAGDGIGLATVSRIVERHGGKTWAQAEVDKGATIFFTFGNADGRRD